MALKIRVIKNHLPACPSPYIVRSESSDVVEFDRFVDLMAKGRTTLTKTDIVAAMQLFREELERQLAEGKTVKTPTGSFFLCASGNVDSLDESFTPDSGDKNHEVRVHHRPERGFEDAVRGGLRIVREESFDQRSPSLRSLVSSTTGESNATKPGDIVQIRGLRLRFDPKATDEGLFFVDAAGAETRTSLYPQIQPSSIIALVPQSLQAGTYELALRSLANGKTLREGVFEGVTVGNG